MIVRATWPEILHVCLNLREDDFKEVMLNRWSECPYELASNFANSPGGKFAVIRDGVPVCIFGVATVAPGIGQAWLVGTDDIGKSGVEIAHAAKKTISTLFDNGVHRIQAYSASFHTQAHKWLETIGFRRESIMRGFGKDGSDFECWTVCNLSS